MLRTSSRGVTNPILLHCVPIRRSPRRSEPRQGTGERARRIWVLAALSIGCPDTDELCSTLVFSRPINGSVKFVLQSAARNSGNADVLGAFSQEGECAGGSSSLGSDLIHSDRLSRQPSGWSRKLDKEIDLRETPTGASSIDYFSRFNTTLPIEYLVDYWKKRIARILRQFNKHHHRSDQWLLA